MSTKDLILQQFEDMLTEVSNIEAHKHTLAAFRAIVIGAFNLGRVYERDELLKDEK